MIEVQRYLIHLPGHDGQPPAEFGWNVDCQVSFDHGVKTAQAWLDDANSGWLWAHLLLERQLYPPCAQRHAFELGFLSCIHQRLCSPLGGDHRAKRTEFKLYAVAPVRLQFALAQAPAIQRCARRTLRSC